MQAKVGAACRSATCSSRSVRDCALMLDCTAGYEPGDPYTAPSPAGAFVDAIDRPPPRLKIALMRKDHRGVKPHAECLRAIDGAAKLCQSLGHVVEEADPSIDLVALRQQTATIAAANTARALGLRWQALQREPNPDDIEAATWAVSQAWGESHRCRVCRGDRGDTHGRAKDGGISHQL